MKNKLALSIVIVAVVFLTGFLYLKCTYHIRPNLVVRSMGESGIYVGDKDRALTATSQHERDIKAIHETGEYIRLGNSYDDMARYDEAAKAYEKAYSLDRGSRAVSGLKLAMTYEKLGRYDDGIILLDQMIKNAELSANGVKNANTIKSRLLTAKSQSTQTQN